MTTTTTTTSTHVRLHYVTDDDFRDAGFVDPGALRRHVVFDGDVAHPTADLPGFPRKPREVAECCFEQFNRGSGREHPALDRDGFRSLSVGDIVEIVFPDGKGSRFYYCDRIGFTEVERP